MQIRLAGRVCDIDLVNFIIKVQFNTLAGSGYFAMHRSGLLSQTFWNCILGEILIATSSSLVSGVYDCRWER